MASNTLKAQVAASPRDLNPSGFDFTAGSMGYYLGSPGTISASQVAAINSSGAQLTLTLPSAAAYPNRHLIISTTSANAVVSDASNVTPLVGATGTAICAATAGKWAHLMSNGVNWQVIAGN